MAGPKRSMCTNPKRGPVEVTCWRRLFAYLLCARRVYQDNQWNVQDENVPTINETPCEEIIEILQRESEDGMEWMNGENVKRIRMFCLFVLNYQWSISLRLWTKAVNKLLVNWRFESSHEMEERYCAPEEYTTKYNQSINQWDGRCAMTQEKIWRDHWNDTKRMWIMNGMDEWRECA